MDNTGPNGSYVPSPGFLKKLMEENLLFQDESLPKYSFLEYKNLLDSSDMRPSNWFYYYSLFFSSCFVVIVIVKMMIVDFFLFNCFDLFFLHIKICIFL